MCLASSSKYNQGFVKKWMGTQKYIFSQQANKHSQGNLKQLQSNSKMPKCAAQTVKGTRCHKGACEGSENGLCTMHDKMFLNNPESVNFYVSKTPTTSIQREAESDDEREKSPSVSNNTNKVAARNPDDDVTSWNTNELFNVAMGLEPEIDDAINTQINAVTSNNSGNDIWSSIAVNFNTPKFSPPDRKLKAPKRRLTPKTLLNLALWMFYRDCCKTPNINNVIRNQIIREGLVKGALLATKDKVVEENGVAKTTKVEIIPYQLVKYATDQVWQRLPEAMREKYFKAVRDDYQRRTAV